MGDECAHSSPRKNVDVDGVLQSVMVDTPTILSTYSLSTKVSLVNNLLKNLMGKEHTLTLMA